MNKDRPIYRHILTGAYLSIAGSLVMAIEDSEGEDGVLQLMVERAGPKLEVDVQLEKLGRFADTFPVDCAKTAILKERTYKYLMDNPGG